jgi:hypothetical protein
MMIARHAGIDTFRRGAAMMPEMKPELRRVTTNFYGEVLVAVADLENPSKVLLPIYTEAGHRLRDDPAFIARQRLGTLPVLIFDNTATKEPTP